MHCFTGSPRARRDRARPRLLPVDLGHRHASSTPTTCAPSSPRRRATGCWSRPTAPTSRPRRTGASATSRPTSPTPPAPWPPRSGIDARRVRRRHLGELRAPVRQGRAGGAGLMPRLRATILGCGSSGGVPRLGGLWGACDPANPTNRRRRCSLLIERVEGEAATRVLIDTSPDLRAQLARRRGRPARRRRLHPRPRRPRARHRRPAHDRTSTAARACRSGRTRRPPTR